MKHIVNGVSYVFEGTIREFYEYSLNKNKPYTCREINGDYILEADWDRDDFEGIIVWEEVGGFWATIGVAITTFAVSYLASRYYTDKLIGDLAEKVDGPDESITQDTSTTNKIVNIGEYLPVMYGQIEIQPSALYNPIIILSLIHI